MTMKFGPTHATIIVVAFLAAMTTIILMGKPEGALVAVGMAILGGIGLSIGRQGATEERVAAVQQQTNGNTRELVQLVAEQTRLLAASTPALDVRPASAPPAITAAPMPTYDYAPNTNPPQHYPNQ